MGIAMSSTTHHQIDGWNLSPIYVHKNGDDWDGLLLLYSNIMVPFVKNNRHVEKLVFQCTLYWLVVWSITFVFPDV